MLVGILDFEAGDADRSVAGRNRCGGNPNPGHCPGFPSISEFWHPAAASWMMWQPVKYAYATIAEAQIDKQAEVTRPQGSQQRKFLAERIHQIICSVAVICLTAAAARHRGHQLFVEGVAEAIS